MVPWTDFITVVVDIWVYCILGVARSRHLLRQLSNLKAPRQVHESVRVDLVPDSPQTCRVARAVQLFRCGPCKRIIRVRWKGVSVDAFGASDLLQRCQSLAYPSIPPVVLGGVCPS